MKASNFNGDNETTKQGSVDEQRSINEQREASYTKSGDTERQDKSYQR